MWRSRPKRSGHMGFRLWLLSLSASILSGCGHDNVPSPANPDGVSQFAFEEITTRWFDSLANPVPEYRNGEESKHCSILESLGGGVAVVDFDRDGWVDFIFPGGGELSLEGVVGGRETRLWRGQDGKRGVEVTQLSKVPASRTYTNGITIGDYDDDGFPDVLLTGYLGVQFWQNQGDGTWADATSTSKLKDDATWSTSAAWGDVNGDGWLDVYVAHYVDWSFQKHPVCLNPQQQRDICPPRQFSAVPHRLWLSRGDGTFADGTATCGLRTDGKGLGVLIADLDADGDLDIYVANDSTPNFLYRNAGNGKFQEEGMLSGTSLSDVGTPDGSMGVGLGDFDSDGLPDLWVANYERELFALYRNLGNCQFQHVSQSMGLGALGGAYVGFGTTFGDWDLNGDEDLVVSNGHVEHVPSNSPVLQLPLLLANRSGARFENVAETAGKYFQTAHAGRGLASADIDHDGDADLVFTPLNESAAILENRSPHAGHWLQLELIARDTPREAIGARVTLVTNTGSRTRQVFGGGSYLSHSDRVLAWGFPMSSRLEKIVVAWPSGRKQTLDPPPWNRRIIVREGQRPVIMFETP